MESHQILSLIHIFRLHEGHSAKCNGSDCSWNGHKTSFVSTGRDDDNFSCWEFTSCSMECNFCTSGGVSNIYTCLLYTSKGIFTNTVSEYDTSSGKEEIELDAGKVFYGIPLDEIKDIIEIK